MKQNGKPMDLLSSVEVFSETMAERFSNGRNSMFIIVSDGDRSLFSSFGQDDEHMDAMSTVIYQNDEVRDIIQGALSLAIVAKIRDRRDDAD